MLPAVKQNNQVNVTLMQACTHTHVMWMMCTHAYAWHCWHILTHNVYVWVWSVFYIMFIYFRSVRIACLHSSLFKTNVPQPCELTLTPPFVHVRSAARDAGDLVERRGPTHRLCIVQILGLCMCRSSDIAQLGRPFAGANKGLGVSRVSTY